MVHNNIKFGNLVLLADFKDIQLLFKYFKVYEIILQPAIKDVLEKLSIMINAKAEKVREKIEKAVDQQFYADAEDNDFLKQF